MLRKQERKTDINFKQEVSGALDQRFEYDIQIWSHKKGMAYQRLESNILIFASFVGSLS